MSTQDDILFEKYFRNCLNQEEKDLFDKRMLDPEFKKQLTIEKQLFHTFNDTKWNFIESARKDKVLEYQDIFDSDEIKELKIALESNKNKHEAVGNEKSIKWKPFIYAAAAAVVILVSLFSYPDQSSDGEEIYATYLDKNQLTYSVVRSVEGDNELSRTRELFFDNKYEEVLPIIDKLIKTPENDIPTLYIMKGISLTELGDFEEAVLTYDKLLNSNYLDAGKAHWYKALLYLKKGDLDMAITTFEKIKKDKLYSHSKASEILELLD